MVLCLETLNNMLLWFFSVPQCDKEIVKKFQTAKSKLIKNSDITIEFIIKIHSIKFIR